MADERLEDLQWVDNEYVVDLTSRDIQVNYLSFSDLTYFVGKVIIMNDLNNKKVAGIAALFDRSQLRNYLLNYIIFIVIIEVFLLVTMIVHTMGPDAVTDAFPWKFYFITAFTIPIVILFVLCITVLAFNKYIFETHPTDLNNDQSESDSSPKEKSHVKNTIYTLGKAPLLLVLFSIFIGAILFYNSDIIYGSIANAGEKAFRFFFISIGIFMVLATLICLTWIYANYKLKRKQMEKEYLYRIEAMEKLGFLILEDNTVINQNSQVVAIPEPDSIEGEIIQDSNKKLLSILDQ